jgi:hypothetical protein
MRAPTPSEHATPDPRRLARVRGRSAWRPRDPLTLWRTTDPARISRADVGRIARRLANAEILHERRWGKARAGDAAAAAAIAVDHLRGLRERNNLSDLIIGNLVVLAGRGDATAPVILAHALRTIGRLDPADPEPMRLAALWSRPRASGRPRRRCRPRRKPSDT